MAEFVLPTTRAIKKILTMMYGDSLEVSQSDDVSLADRHAATYIADDDKLVAVCACDAEFVAYSGAALTMVPADVANEMVINKNFSDVILANFHEVMNICSRLLMSDASPHLRLDKTLLPTSAGTAISELQPSAGIAGFNVSIPNYGDGSVVFLIA